MKIPFLMKVNNDPQKLHLQIHTLNQRNETRVWECMKILKNLNWVLQGKGRHSTTYYFTKENQKVRISDHYKPVEKYTGRQYVEQVLLHAFLKFLIEIDQNHSLFYEQMLVRAQRHEQNIRHRSVRLLQIKQVRELNSFLILRKEEIVFIRQALLAGLSTKTHWQTEFQESVAIKIHCNNYSFMECICNFDDDLVSLITDLERETKDKINFLCSEIKEFKAKQKVVLWSHI